MKKYILTAVFFVFAACFVAAQNSGSKLSASQIKTNSLQKDDIASAIEYVDSQVENTASNADKRSTLYYLGSLYELKGDYAKASYSYALAAGIGAGDAAGMPKVSSEQLVLDAVKASLNAGDCETASLYLNSAVRSSRNEEIQAKVKLYSIWSDLVAAESVEETQESIVLLKAYSSLQSMKSVKPAVLLTLWYLTDEREYSQALESEFPLSPEYGIVSGSLNVMSSPFWYFVPRSEHSLTESVPHVETSVASGAVPSSASGGDAGESSGSSTARCQQLGLFRDVNNADALVIQAKAKGFNAYSYEETRTSGTTYYIVVVDENAQGTMGAKLKAAGFECYPLF